MKKQIAAITVLCVLVLTPGSAPVLAKRPLHENDLKVSEKWVQMVSAPEQRSFDMGFVPWPYDFTYEAVKDTYAFIDEHADLIAHHFDDGVPWPEALYNKPYHESVFAELETHIKGSAPEKKVYVAINPISPFSSNRNAIADYWAETNNMELPSEWECKSFDDPDVINAYTNHVLFMIGYFNPDYLAYGIEVNMLAKSNPDAYEKFIVLIENVYTSVKKVHPDLPLFLSIEIETFVSDKDDQIKAIKKLLPFTDYIALSTYPYMLTPNPDDMPIDWFTQLIDMAPEKPFAIAETAFIAEELVFSVEDKIRGSNDWQAKYMEFLLRQANKHNAEFIVWFIPRDYDKAWEKMKKMGASKVLGAWKDAGLLDETGKERGAFKIWKKWLDTKKGVSNKDTSLCKFPKLDHDSIQIIKTVDEGNYNEALILLYGGDKDNFHMVGMISDPFVLNENNEYKMWFTGMHEKEKDVFRQGVAYATSVDGLVWSDTKNLDTGMDLVLKPKEGDWDELGMETVSVIKNHMNNKYYLYYAGRTSSAGAYKIGFAYSDDGVTWLKNEKPLLEPMYAWEKQFEMPKDVRDGTGTLKAGELSGGMLEPTILYDDKEKLFKMWYSTLGLEDGESYETWGGRVGYATSEDGLSWKRQEKPVFLTSESGWDSSWVSHTHVIKDPIKGYHLFYAGSNEDIYGIGHAYSEDGKLWKRNPNNPLLKNDKGSWHSKIVGGPSVLIKDGNFELWFFGSKKDNFAHVFFGCANLVCNVEE
jgi:predicted GH43/DUF377 family glycosyl hydrolase